MKLKIFIPVIVLAIILQACSSGAVSAGKQELVTPTSAPTGTPVPENPTEKAYYDDFSGSDPGWSELLTVTTQAQPGQMKSSARVVDGLLTFDFQEKETYLYKFFANPSGADVVIESKVQGAGQLENGMALVCRAKNDQTAWYEARISGLNQYDIYRFDAAQRDAEKNPYIKLQHGALRGDIFKPTKQNVIRFTCQGSDLMLEVNDQTITTVQDGTLSEGGLAGVGAMSGTILPLSVRFDYFSYGQP